VHHPHLRGTGSERLNYAQRTVAVLIATEEEDKGQAGGKGKGEKYKKKKKYQFEPATPNLNKDALSIERSLVHTSLRMRPTASSVMRCARDEKKARKMGGEGEGTERKKGGKRGID